MAPAMTRFGRQRLVGMTLFVLAGIGVVYFCLRVAPAVPRFGFLSGWILFGVMLMLTVFNARKKLPFLPLGTAEGWLQFHLYAGWFSLVLFAAHLRVRVPTGWFEGVLAGLYLLVFLSGVIGLVMTRVFPQRLTTRGGEVIFELIPSIRRRLLEQAEALVLQAIPASSSTTMADFYLRRLKNFFESPPRFWRQLFGDRRAVNELLAEINDLHRFLEETERERLRQISDLVRQKDGLDYHYVLQRTLKLWLFIHIPFTYALLLFSFLHIVLVYSFSGDTG